MPRTLTATAALIIWAAACAAMLVGCNKVPDPKAQIRAWLAAAERQANDGDTVGIGERIAADYKDVEGRDRDMVIGRVERHVKRHKKRFVHVRPLSIKVDGGAADVSVIVALAGRRIGPDDDLLKVSADLIKLELKLRRDVDAWLCTSARWRRPSPLDVL